MLPFGLGQDPKCIPASSCRYAGIALPPSGTPLHDQVAISLSLLFSTFYSTSLRYLGVSEILDWIEGNKTLDSWILSGLEQGRTIVEVGNKKNLGVGKGAITSVVKNALSQDENAWATSLREVAFSSSMSMSYEGVMSQLQQAKSTTSPCLHSLISPIGLATLKSAPLNHAFPVCPPRAAPSPTSLINSIRDLISTGVLTGPQWKSSAVWKTQIKKVFISYHTMVKEVAESIIYEPSFSTEYTIFLETISQPIQLLMLIKQDFEEEFGANVHKGLLGVGDVGGKNLEGIMKFCNSNRPSELLSRVEKRVEEKKEKESLLLEMADREAKIERYDREEQLLLVVQDNLVASGASNKGLLKVRNELEVIDRERACLLGELIMDQSRILALTSLRPQTSKGDDEENVDLKLPAIGKEVEIQQGSSKDLAGLVGNLTVIDPFSSTAPRAVLAPTSSSKGKGKAKAQPIRRGTGAPTNQSATVVDDAILASSNIRSKSSSPVPSQPLPPQPLPEGSFFAAPTHTTPASVVAINKRPSEMGKSVVREENNTTTNSAPSNPPSHQIPTPSPQPVLPKVPRDPSQQTSADKKRAKKEKKRLALPTSNIPSTENGKLDVGIGRYFDRNYTYPTRSCPPDRCTGETANYANWNKLDDLLFEIFWAGFKYELTVLLSVPMEMIRNALGELFLKSGGKLVSLPNQLSQIDLFLGSHAVDMWEMQNDLDIENYIQRMIAICCQKLVEVLKSSIGDICVCRLSNNFDIISQIKEKLTSAEIRDRKLPVELEPFDYEMFVEEIRSDQQSYNGIDFNDPNFESHCKTFLLDFATSFDHSVSEMVKTNPFALIVDYLSLLKRHGGIRTFDTAIRLSEDKITEDIDFGDREEALNPLADWAKLIRIIREEGYKLPIKLESADLPKRSRDGYYSDEDDEERVDLKKIAEEEKQLGNNLFAQGKYHESLVLFSMASLINPVDSSYWTNAAVARIKIGTPANYSAAVADCTAALYFDYNNHKALYRRGTALALLGRWDQSILDLEKLVGMSPDNGPARETLEWVKGKKNVGEENDGLD